MNKNIFKKFAFLVVMLFVVVSLSACGKKTVSYEGINDNVYAKSGQYQITNRELYDLLKYQKSGFTFNSPQKLEELKNEALFKPYMDKITFTKTGETLRDADEDDLNIYEKDVRDIILNAVYSTTEQEDIDKMTAKQKASAEIKFLDTLVGKGVLTSDIFDIKVLNSYKLDLAKKDYARELLKISVTEEFLYDSKGKITDDENPNYISNKDVETYFENNYEDKNPLDAILIRFVSKDEADQTLRLFGQYTEGTNVYRGLKSYKNKFYLIRLEDADITEEDYIKYYNDYTVDPSKDQLLDNLQPTINGKQAPQGLCTLVEFVKIYQYMYSYKTKITDQDITNLMACETLDAAIDIIKEFDDQKFNYEYDELNDINSSLRSYMYDTLVADRKEGTSVSYRYTSTPRSYDTSYYLAYKLTDQVQSEIDDSIREEIRTKLFDEKLTDSYVTEQTNKLLELVEFKIYDPEMELMFKLNNLTYKKSSDKSNEYVASLTVSVDEKLLITEEATYNITPIQFFEKMESTAGPSYAFNKLAEEALLNSKYADEITEKDEEEFRENFKAIISSFSSNNFEQYGLPATMGRKGFIKLYFNADSIDEVISTFYRTSKIMENYLADIEEHYGKGNETYQKLRKYAVSNYDLYYSTTANHFLIYMDIDEDGNPDDPKDYLDTLTDAKKADFTALVYEFSKEIYLEASSSVDSHYNRFTSLVEEFNSSTRIVPEPKTCEREPSLTSCKWAKYKKAGLNVKTEDLSEITNTTSLTFDEKFIEKFEEMLNSQNMNINEQYMQPIGVSYDDLLTSSFGWHIIVITGATKQLSAKFLESDDDFDGEKLFNNIQYFEDGKTITLNAYNTSNYPSLNQIEIYMRERKYTNGVENLPSAVLSSMEQTFAPIITKYESEENKLFLLRNFLLTIETSSLDGVSFTNVNLNNYLHETFKTTVRTSIGYDYYQNESKNPLGTWFKDFYNFSL